MWKFWKRTPKNSPEAQRAKDDAAYHLEKIRARTAHVERQAEELREVRLRNHFAEQIAQAMGGKR